MYHIQDILFLLERMNTCYLFAHYRGPETKSVLCNMYEYAFLPTCTCQYSIHCISLLDLKTN